MSMLWYEYAMVPEYAIVPEYAMVPECYGSGGASYVRYSGSSGV